MMSRVLTGSEPSDGSSFAEAHLHQNQEMPDVNSAETPKNTPSFADVARVLANLSPAERELLEAMLAVRPRGES